MRSGPIAIVCSSERTLHRLERLVGQAVDQVEIDAHEAQFAALLDHLAHHLNRLDALHVLLHARVEILHAERGAVEAEAAQRFKRFARGDARVELHRDFGVVRQRETVGDRGVQPLDLARRQVGRRAAAPVNLPQRRFLAERARQIADLALQCADVRLGALRRALFAARLGDARAGAIAAKLLAKRNVDVERQVTRIRARPARRTHLVRIGGVHILPPGRHRIGHVPRQRDAGVLAKDLQIDRVERRHDHAVSSFTPTSTCLPQRSQRAGCC